MCAEIEAVSAQMRQDRDIVIISDGALFLICRKVVSSRHNDYFFQVDSETERIYMLFRRGKTRVISYSQYAYDTEDFLQ